MLLRYMQPSLSDFLCATGFSRVNVPQSLSHLTVAGKLAVVQCRWQRQYCDTWF